MVHAGRIDVHDLVSAHGYRVLLANDGAFLRPLRERAVQAHSIPFLDPQHQIAPLLVRRRGCPIDQQLAGIGTGPFGQAQRKLTIRLGLDLHQTATGNVAVDIGPRRGVIQQQVHAQAVLLPVELHHVPPDPIELHCGVGVAAWGDTRAWVALPIVGRDPSSPGSEPAVRDPFAHCVRLRLGHAVLLRILVGPFGLQ